MLFLNPNTGGPSEQILDWMTGGINAPPGVGHISCIGGSARCLSPAGTTFQQWFLGDRNLFHDGTPVTADDVCFSILSYRDVPAVSFFASVSAVQTCSHTDQKTVQVTLSGSSPFFELGIGSLPIIPAHIWGSVAGWPQGPYDSAHEPAIITLATSTASTLSFDPVAAGIMVGSGPWICNSSVGVSTISGQASCAKNANGSAGGQALSPGSSMVFDRNLGYRRCCDNLQVPEDGLTTTNLQVLQWFDIQKFGIIDQRDVSEAAICFGQGAASITNTPFCTQNRVSYWAHALYSSWSMGFGGTVPGSVDEGDIASVAFIVFESGITTPYGGSPSGPFTATGFTGPNGVLLGLDYVTDSYVIYSVGSGPFPGPYNTSPGSPIGYFQGCYRVLGTTNQIQCSADTSPTGAMTASSTLTPPGGSAITASATPGSSNFMGKTLWTFTASGTFTVGKYAFSVASYSTTIIIIS